MCNPGFIGDGRTCVEGTCNDKNCPINAECIMPSKPDCRCKNGFELKLSESDETCEDIDECISKVCHEKAICTNSAGEYECNCKEGFFGDGKTCFPGSCTDANCPARDNKKCISPRKPDCECTEGFEMKNMSVCVDVDECQKRPCDQNANCANTPGTFSCTCKKDYLGDGFSCDVKKTVLVLNTYERYAAPRRTPPVVVDAEGRMDSNILFSHIGETEVYLSCSVMYRNKYYVFGGVRQMRQISELTGCELRRIGSLKFNHAYGSCSTFGDREILLCFDWNDNKQCRSAVDPLGDFTKIEPSTHEHEYARTASTQSK